MFWATLGDDFEIERACCCGAHASADTRKDDLVDVGYFDERGRFRDEEDVFFEEEEVALDGF